MRKWGRNIEIDGSFYTRAGANLTSTATDKAQFAKDGSWLYMEGDANAYELAIENMMKEISSNRVGEVLIGGIERAGRNVRIIPITAKEYGVKMPTPKGQPQQYRSTSANRVGNYSSSGNDCVIWFEPYSSMQGFLAATDGTSPYQVLVHELQHALRQVRGKLNLGGLIGAFPNPEELYSTMVENMYLSAAGQPDRMRANYFVKIPFNSRKDRDFFKFYMEAINDWCDELRDMTLLLERIYGIWNPIRVRRMVLDSVLPL